MFSKGISMVDFAWFLIEIEVSALLLIFELMVFDVNAFCMAFFKGTVNEMMRCGIVNLNGSRRLGISYFD